MTFKQITSLIIGNLEKADCSGLLSWFRAENRRCTISDVNPCGESDQLIVHLNFAKNG